MMRVLIPIAAVAYLVAMASSPMLLESFDTTSVGQTGSWYGLLGASPQSISKLELIVDAHSYEIVRVADGWSYQGGLLNKQIADSASVLCAMLSRAEPVRTFLPEDLVQVKSRDYGFAETQLQIKVERGERAPHFELQFGRATPEGGLYYARKDDDPALYVMSGFLVQQATDLAKSLTVNSPASHAGHAH